MDETWERPRAAAGPGFSDAVTFAFGDPGADVYGVARVGLSTADPQAPPTASGLALVFADGVPVAVRADGGIELGEVAWDRIDAAGVRTTIEEPLRAWTVAFTDTDPGTGFELRFQALADPAVLDDEHPAARTGGMTGYESYCRVTGTVTAGGRTRRVDGFGQRGHSWGAPDWERLTMARTVSVWLDDGHAVSLTAIRDKRAGAHDAEAVAAYLLSPGPGDGDAPSVWQLVDEPLLSTTYDGEGRQRSAGLELYETEESPARRAAGEAVCGTTLDLGRLRLDCAFFRWRMEGREGVGRYDVLRRV